jgi:hypothetical protein
MVFYRILLLFKPKNGILEQKGSNNGKIQQIRPNNIILWLIRSNNGILQDITAI